MTNIANVNIDFGNIPTPEAPLPAPTLTLEEAIEFRNSVKEGLETFGKDIIQFALANRGLKCDFYLRVDDFPPIDRTGPNEISPPLLKAWIKFYNNDKPQGIQIQFTPNNLILSKISKYWKSPPSPSDPVIGRLHRRLRWKPKTPEPKGSYVDYKGRDIGKYTYTEEHIQEMIHDTGAHLRSLMPQNFAQAFEANRVSQQKQVGILPAKQAIV